MRKRVFCFSVLVCLLLFSGCTKSTQLFAMDTVITMEATGINASDALELATEELLRLEQLLSIRGESSDIAALNAHETETVSTDTAELLQKAYSLSLATGGAYDCTVEPAVAAWGWYDTPAVPKENALRDAMELVNNEALILDGNTVRFQFDGMGIDLGGIAKGYSAGRIGDLLKDNGIRSAILSLGGNIRAIGKKPNGQPWIVGIADPAMPSSYLATVAVEDTAVVTSGDYQRFFTENGSIYHHILDPQTGYPTENGLHAVTIICKDDTLADGLSTALFVMGLEDGSQFWKSGVYDFDAVFISDSGIYITEGLQSCFSCQTSYEVIFR